jgi:hypothetical protein
MFISVPDRIRIRPKVSDPYGSGSGSGFATLLLNSSFDSAACWDPPASVHINFERKNAGSTGPCALRPLLTNLTLGPFVTFRVRSDKIIFNISQRSDNH